MTLSTSLIVGGDLFVAADRAGYEVISNRGLTVCEITGNGNWGMFEKACRKFVKHTHAGHKYDHVTIVMRHGDGTRDFRDVGTGGVRFGYLPPVGFKCQRKYQGLGVRGVRAEGHRFRCQMTVHGARLYLGLYATVREAGMVRDRYAISHGLDLVLNYPGEVETLLLA